MTAIFPHSENPELAKLREQNRQLVAENERRSAEVAFLRGQINAASDCRLLNSIEAVMPLRSKADSRP